MRFLTGMLFGTALTLLAATAVDAPTHALLERSSSQAESAWHRLLTFTSAALFDRPDTVASIAVAPSTTVADTPASASALEPEADLELKPEAERNSAHSSATLTLEEQATALASTPFDIPLVRAPSPLELPVVVPDQAPFKASTAQTDLETATVWVPFHSERSALGFARRLTSEVQHPFAVERKGPGAYQVFYEAASADEIAGLQARIAEVTGR